MSRVVNTEADIRHSDNRVVGYQYIVGARGRRTGAHCKINPPGQYGGTGRHRIDAKIVVNKPVALGTGIPGTQGLGGYQDIGIDPVSPGLGVAQIPEYVVPDPAITPVGLNPVGMPADRERQVINIIIVNIEPRPVDVDAVVVDIVYLVVMNEVSTVSSGNEIVLEIQAI
ncbi:MAG: hypothetical protein A4E66_02020 [Syntrophus sp. PtaB.Bin001]|nr:MAG: hypothetical protein A4E66_02020 [Syntrophus sp. PtaB.Bin001]